MSSQELVPAGSHTLVINEPDNERAIMLMDSHDLEQAMAELRAVFIYGLYDPSGALRYIGQALDPARRLREHVMPCNLRDNSHKTHWIVGLLLKGQSPSMAILEITDEQSWRECERRHIAAARAAGATLTNLTDGGDGTLGRRHDAATIAKISAARIGDHWSAERRAQASLARRGRKMSAEAIAKSAAARRGQTYSAETLARMSAAKKGRPLSAVNRAALARAHKGQPKTAEHRAKVALVLERGRATQKARREQGQGA